MADIRIKDLTTTASSTASDDFIAVDGTTNGTRKLNAFSPTFGGNATVTGTLTANGAITGPTLAPGVNTAAHYFTAYGASASWPFRISTIYDADYVDHYLTLNGTLTGSRATPTFTGAAAGGAFLRANGFTSTLSIGTFVGGASAAINTVANFNPTNVTIPQTTASTTTSSGALVVSGGAGVAGNLYVGGSTGVVVTTAAYARLTNTTSDASSAADIRLWNTGASGRDIFLGSQGSTSTIADARSRFMLYDNTGGGLVLSASGADNVKIHLSTASTSTSSGALVVSGGVGVAGAANVGGNLTVNGTITLYPDQDGFFSGSWPRMNFTTNGSSVWLSGATTGAATVQHDFRNRSGTSLLTLGGTGNAIFAGNLKTAAPAGGTAAEWKLGTVATVSPTSPNRTIEVDIGGTIYYIHAKTTNN